MKIHTSAVIFLCILGNNLLEHATTAKTWAGVRRCVTKAATACHDRCKSSLQEVLWNKVKDCEVGLFNQLSDAYADCLTKRGFPITNTTACWKENIERLRLRRQVSVFKGFDVYGDCFQDCLMKTENLKALAAHCTQKCPEPVPEAGSEFQKATAACTSVFASQRDAFTSDFVHCLMG